MIIGKSRYNVFQQLQSLDNAIENLTLLRGAMEEEAADPSPGEEPTTPEQIDELVMDIAVLTELAAQLRRAVEMATCAVGSPSTARH